jgi:hypothetical protein
MAQATIETTASDRLCRSRWLGDAPAASCARSPNRATPQVCLRRRRRGRRRGELDHSSIFPPKRVDELLAPRPHLAVDAYGINANCTTRQPVRWRARSQEKRIAVGPLRSKTRSANV